MKIKVTATWIYEADPDSSGYNGNNPLEVDKEVAEECPWSFIEGMPDEIQLTLEEVIDGEVSGQSSTSNGD